ncbi:transcription initiation factor IIF, beta subunit-domain-containing protein, partial [Pisolithus croceorrhizus]
FGGEDEKKFDPDPDEELILDRGNGRVWLVKANGPAIDKEDIHLATIRIYPNAVSPSGRSPRIFLFLPPDPNDPTPRAPDLPQFPSNAAYVPMGEGGMENQLVPTTSSAFNPRARTTILTGRIKHECNLRPLFNESYRLQMRERSRAYNTPKRQIRMIEEAGVSGGRGGINRLSTGISTGSFADMIKAKQKPVKGTFERMARMPRNQLLDMLFQLFQEQPRWSIKPLRERTQQPEAYLKEVLNEIATLHRSGEYNGLWELSEIFAREGVKAENVPGASSETSIADAMMDDYDEDDDEDDMEEVS